MAGVERRQPRTQSSHAMSRSRLITPRLILGPLLPLVASLPSYGQQKSLVIGIDGLGFGQQGFSVAETPSLDSLIDGSFAGGAYRGAYTDDAFAGGIVGTPSQQSTVSGPGWSSILTGVWIDKHNVSGNSFSAPNFRDNPTYLATLKAALPDLKTASFINWSPIDTHIISSADSDANPENDLDFRRTYGSDPLVAAGAAELLAGSGILDPDVVFVAFDEVDAAGHSCGSSGACYQREIQEVDALVGQLLATITVRPFFNEEDWQIVVTSDHGHTPFGGHGGQSDLERRIPFIVSSKTLNEGTLPSFPEAVAHVDVAPTVLSHFGVPLAENYVGFSRALGAIMLTPDINGDGLISGNGTGPFETDDVTAFMTFWLQPNTLDEPNPADLNLDGVANLADWAIVNAADPIMGQNIMNAVIDAPEPSGFVLMLLGFMLFRCRWSRDRRRH